MTCDTWECGTTATHYVRVEEYVINLCEGCVGNLHKVKPNIVAKLLYVQGKGK